MSYVDREELNEEEHLDEDDGLLIQTRVVGGFVRIFSEIWIFGGIIITKK